MTSAEREAIERRVLILAPTGRDAELTSSVLGEAGIPGVAAADLPALLREMRIGAAAVLVAEEQIADGQAHELARTIADQPPWSDLPVLVLTRHGADSPVVSHAMETLGNVTLLERPARVAALVSAVRVALRARERQYRMRAQLADSERRNEEMQALLDTLPIGVFIAHDPGCQRISGNQRGCDILRLPDDANLSKTAPVEERPTHFKACRDGLEIPAEELPLQRAARGVAVLGARVDLVFDSGRTLHTIVSASPLFHPDGRARGAVAAIVDVTAQKNAEAALREADRRKDEFLATLAHELRNPLAPICNSIHVLRLLEGASPAAVRVCEMMERQANHIVRLVDDLLDVSRITRGKVELRRERVELAAVVRSAVETSRPLIDAGHHELSVTLPPEPLTLDADSVRLAQVLANLLNNAAKYTEPGGRIVLTVERCEREVVVSVRDSGVGIPREMLPCVFDMFTQADRTRGGLGIGLTLARSLIEMHGGRIQAQSDGPGRGSEFQVHLPLFTDTRTAQASGLPHAPTRLPSTIRVLVVDDNHDAAKSLGMVLELLGAQVRVVNDGRAALALLDDYEPSVVLLDLGMPEMDGYEVARRIRERRTTPHVTIIALTGWGQESDRRRTHASGFDHHMVKPPDMHALQELIATAAANADDHAH